MPILFDTESDIRALQPQLVAWRRDFHRHPELGFAEHRAAGAIAEHLRNLGYRVETGIAATGVVGLLEGSHPGPVAMVRFDMDALPILEQSDAEYASQNRGAMHACGHDAHMAVGLGVATVIASHRQDVSGTLKIVFQPGEEGMNGAEVMVREGVLDDPRPDVFLALHVWNGDPAGTVAVAPGPVMAAADRWTCTVRGKGGHGAMPHQTVDPIVAAAQIVTALQTIVSRNVSPLETAVVTVGTIHAGDAFNVIPSTVELSGTIRSFSPQVRATVVRRLPELVEGVAASFGASADLTIESLSPAVVNHPEVAAVVRAAAEAVLGAANVSSDQRTTGSEDAAFFMQDVPGCYFLVGSANPARGLDAPHHNPRFDIDEAALGVGVAVMLGALAHYL